MEESVKKVLRGLAIQARIVLSTHLCVEHGEDCGDRDNLISRIQEADKLLGESTELIYERNEK